MKVLYRLLIVVAVAMGPSACGTTGSGPGSGSEATAPGSYISGSDRGVAIEGYDPVAYHTEGEAVRGSPDHTVQWAGT